MVLYEHPLNERIRNYLKLEQLFAQVKGYSPEQISNNYQVFFNALFAIIDTMERNDVRGELIKDLEKLEQHLVVWSQSPEIDGGALEDNLKHVIALVCQLKATKPTWFQLRNDKLLASIKQRFAIQGGSSAFDLPQLQFWLHQPIDKITKDIDHWLFLLSQVYQAIKLVLKFIRQRSAFEKIETDSGFFQDSGEGLLLLRIKVTQDAQYYPTVSGNRFRYSIRFMSPCDSRGRKYANQATKFELSRC
ncbi:cell division protein ZapD [Thalassotalea atypica]|uniref:cell division protein ZapD n=1 Tax=Thalassotalea atypica TaxID=2054316 RepID=UPI002573BFC5|nr:cell division protein ZapD [Thalassotalea atypica]